jgi:hypothetical protein
MRYIVGIDLGTTNSCVSYIDTQDPKLGVKSFRIPQLTASGTIEAQPTLPSFCYLPAYNEFPETALKLPWTTKNEKQPHFFVGSLAKHQGAKVPTRLIQSAKSWLCHSAANRRDRILPVEAADESQRMSPVEATMHYLSHIKAAWNEGMAKGDSEADFDGQEIVLTVPASFDEVARNLTVEAAKKAGFLQLTLLEEPQAAFYSWIAQHENTWETQLKSGMQILVCDVGGGTTDFSLIEVVETGSKLSFRRMAVGDHLLLGGDNMDAALSHFLEGKLQERGDELTTTQRQQLLHEARAAKEKLLSSSSENCRIVLYGEGSGVVKGAVSVDIHRDELKELLLNGFFGNYTWNDALKLNRAAGFRTMGLPYENEPSIVKHLARFLEENSAVKGDPIKPDFILFNGGAMTPELFRQAILANLRSWFPQKTLEVLPSYHLDLAVARGAAYFGKARRGLGVKIGGGLARGYYLILDAKDQEGGSEKKALALMPRGSEEGEVFEPGTTFMLTPNTPVSFQLATSHVRLHDNAGDLISIEPDEFHLLPPIITLLRYGKKQGDQEQEKIPVHLVITLSPIGTLDIGLKSLKTEHRWTLEFQLRSASGQDNQISATSKRSVDQTFDATFLNEAERLITQVFSSEPGPIKLAQLPEKLEALLGMPKREWPPSLMRGLADIFLKVGAFRKVSSEHAGRWWNLTGFLMRPGFGYPLDDFRIKEIWKLILSDFKTTLSPELQVQMWICYRRIAGGMNKGQQMQAASDLIATLFSKRSGKIETGNKTELYAYSEKIRALASMELLEISTKMRIGHALAMRIRSGHATSVDYWSLGRLGARHLLYGSIVNVIPKNVCEEWIEQILDIPCKEEERLVFLLEQLARKTEHRELNVSTKLVDRIIAKFESTAHSQRLKDVLLNETRLTQQEQEDIFGEHLPIGLTLEC